MTRYALPLTQLRALAASQSEALWKIRNSIHEAEIGTISRQLEACIIDAYGRLEITDLFTEQAQLQSRLQAINNILTRKVGASTWHNLHDMSDPKTLALQIAKQGGNLERHLPQDLADEVRQVAYERGLVMVQHFEETNFDNGALSDNALSVETIFQKLKQSLDVDAIRALLETQQSEALQLLQRRHPGANTTKEV